MAVGPRERAGSVLPNFTVMDCVLQVAGGRRLNNSFTQALPVCYLGTGGHDVPISWLLNNYIYVHSAVLPSALAREASFCADSSYYRDFITGQRAENKRLDHK